MNGIGPETCLSDYMIFGISIYRRKFETITDVPNPAG